MNPDQVAAELIRIADQIDADELPSRSSIASSLWAVLSRTATDKSLAKGLADSLSRSILELFPSGTFEDQLYDTHEEGKGYHAGLVSFGLKPAAWGNAQLIGGILVRATYSPKVVKSESPEPGTPEHKAWLDKGGHSKLQGGEAEVATLSAGYYNKKLGGGVSEWKELGEAIFTVSKTEEVLGFELDSPEKVKAGIDAIVDEVLKNPPDGSSSARRVRSQSPLQSFKKFLEYLWQEGRNWYTKDELNELARNVPKKTVGELQEKLRLRGLSMRTAGASPLTDRPDYGV